MKSFLRRSFVCATVAVLTTSCRPAADIQPNDVQTYTVPRQATPVTAATRAPADATPSTPPGGPTVAYDLPEGWRDLGGSSMRLATLRTGPDDAADAGEITIIPASGTLRDNATRWQEQLTPAANPERVSRAIEEAEKVAVNGTEGTILLLVDEATEDPQAILVAMIPLDGSASLFVKFKGPATAARTIRETFTTFVRSIRWQ